MCAPLLYALYGCDQRPMSQQPTAMLVEAACGQCLFDQPGGGCDLAIRTGDGVYFVDGSGIDDHGDAHGSDGLCNAIRMADVFGSVENGRFVATSFALRPTVLEHD